MLPCWMLSLIAWQKTWDWVKDAFWQSERHCSLYAEVPGPGRDEASDRAAFG